MSLLCENNVDPNCIILSSNPPLLKFSYYHPGCEYRRLITRQYKVQCVSVSVSVSVCASEHIRNSRCVAILQTLPINKLTNLGTQATTKQGRPRFARTRVVCHVITKRTSTGHSWYSDHSSQYISSTAHCTECLNSSILNGNCFVNISKHFCYANILSHNL